MFLCVRNECFIFRMYIMRKKNTILVSVIIIFSITQFMKR